MNTAPQKIPFVLILVTDINEKEPYGNCVAKFARSWRLLPRLMFLTVVGVFIKESTPIEPTQSLTGDDVPEILDHVSQLRGYPEAFQTVQGP